MTEQQTAIVPACKWTHDGDRVLILKCINADGTSYNGFQWPESGSVMAPDWNDRPECGGGLHGWPWGLAMGDGREPDYRDSRWLVLAALPRDVVDISGKCKSRLVEVICNEVGHRGYINALAKILPGQLSWVIQAASGVASATGGRGVASATGGSGVASATGGRGAASATGERGAASATGESGAASATGGRGAASATGWSGATSATGERGAASATGGRGVASATGESCTLEVGGCGLACTTAAVCYWRVRSNAVLVQRTPRGLFVIQQELLKLPDGELVKVEHGEITR